MIIQGDCLIELKKLPSNTVDSIVTDPPYGLGFMGKSWDKTGIANNVLMWNECLRVLKPGGHLLAFSGTRTYHRMASAIEDAGFEVRDMIEWVYGSGFPKSLNIGKAVDKLRGNEREDLTDNPNHRRLQKTGTMVGEPHTGDGKVTKGTSEWEGWGTALKPSHESIVVARKPLSEKTVAENVLKWGTGGINIDVSRVSAYIDGDNSENIVLSHKLSELLHKLHTLLFSCVADKKDCPTPANDVECVEMWKKLADCLGDCSPYSRLYDELSRLFLKGDQVSVQQLHDALGDIDRLRKEQSSSLSSPHSDRLSNLDDFYHLILSYLNDTTLYIKKQVNLGRNNKARTSGTSYVVQKEDKYIDNSGGLGRFPANLIHDNSEEVRECFPETKTGGGDKTNKGIRGESIGNVYGNYNPNPNPKEHEVDLGNASRFFKSITSEFNPSYTNGTGDFKQYFKSIIYQAKASKSERNKGCEEIDAQIRVRQGLAGEKKDTVSSNFHPTVKPVALMEYLIKMVTPKGGTVLDPFMGSGSTGVAAKKNGYDFIGIELDKEYCKIAEKRINGK